MFYRKNFVLFLVFLVKDWILSRLTLLDIFLIRCASGTGRGGGGPAMRAVDAGGGRRLPGSYDEKKLSYSPPFPCLAGFLVAKRATDADGAGVDVCGETRVSSVKSWSPPKYFASVA